MRFWCWSHHHSIHSRCPPEVFLQSGVLWHLPNVFPVLVCGRYNHTSKVMVKQMQWHKREADFYLKRTFLRFYCFTLKSSLHYAVCSWPAGKPMTLNILSSWSWWKGLLVLMSSWRQWKMGSDVSSSAKMQPIAQISDAHTHKHIHTWRRHLVWVLLYISYSALVFTELMKFRFSQVCWKIDFTFAPHRWLFMVNIKTFVTFLFF